MKRIHVIVHGSVQGVGYRYYTSTIANQMKVTGWVRNLPNGTVECLAEGKEDALETFLDYLKKGSMYASVTEIEVYTLKEQNFCSTFSIR